MPVDYGSQEGTHLRVQDIDGEGKMESMYVMEKGERPLCAAA